MPIPTPTYGTPYTGGNAPPGSVNVFDPNTGKPLAGSGAFNPNTGQAITSSSGTARAEEASLGKGITEQSNPAYSSPANTQYLAAFDAQSAILDTRKAQEDANVNAQFEGLKASMEGQQKRETGSTSVALARAGGYLGISGSGTGVLLNLAQTHRAEMQALESKRQNALADARNAYTDKKFDVARLRASEAKSFEKESYRRQQDYFDKITKASDENKKNLEASAVLERKQKTQVDIYNAIAGGKTDPMEIFQELGGNTSIADINEFLTKSTPKDVKGDFAYTPSQTALLLGSGLSALDIKAAQDYINLNGYTEEFRSQLSGSQRVAFDKVYREKAVNEQAMGVNLTPDNKRDLQGVNYTPSQIQHLVDGVNTYGFQTVYDLEKAGGATPEQLKVFQKVYGVEQKVTQAQIQSSMTTKQAQEGLKDTYTDEELSDLARANGFALWFTGKAGEVEKFLNSDKAKELYTALLYQQYKEAGMAE